MLNFVSLSCATAPQRHSATAPQRHSATAPQRKLLLVFMLTFMSTWGFAQVGRIVPLNNLGTACDACRLRLTTDVLPDTSKAPYEINWTATSSTGEEINERSVFDPANGRGFTDLDQDIQTTTDGLWEVTLRVRSLVDFDVTFLDTQVVQTGCYRNVCPTSDFAMTHLGGDQFGLLTQQSQTLYTWSAFDYDPVSGSHGATITNASGISGTYNSPVFTILTDDEGIHFIELATVQSNGCQSLCEKSLLATSVAPAFAINALITCSGLQLTTVNLVPGTPSGDWKLLYGNSIITTQTGTTATFDVTNVNNLPAPGNIHRRAIKVRFEFNNGTGTTTYTQQINTKSMFIGSPGQTTLLSDITGLPSLSHVLPAGGFNPTAQRNFYVRGTLVIDQNYNFSNIRFFMGDGAKIIVGTSSNPSTPYQLGTNNCDFTLHGASGQNDLIARLNCQCMWQGMTVNDAYTDLNSVFLRAHKAINLINADADPFLSLQGTDFMRNHIGIYALSNPVLGNFHSTDFIGGSFPLHSTCVYQPNDVFNKYSYAGIYADINTAQSFNIPPGANNGADYNNFELLNNGIISWSHDMLIQNSRFDRCYRYGSTTNEPNIRGNAIFAYQRSRNNIQVIGFGSGLESEFTYFNALNFVTVVGDGSGGWFNTVKVSATKGRAVRGVNVNKAMFGLTSANHSLVDIQNNNFIFEPTIALLSFEPTDLASHGVFLSNGDNPVPNEVNIIENNFHSGINQALLGTFTSYDGVHIDQPFNTLLDLKVSQNDINMTTGINGIFLNNVQSGFVGENLIEMRSDFDDGLTLKGGVHVAGGNGNTVYCNNIIGEGTEKSSKTSGVILDGSVFSTVAYNTLDDLDLGLVIHNINEFPDIRQNDFQGASNIRLFFGTDGQFVSSPNPTFAIQHDKGNYFLNPKPSWGIDVVSFNQNVPEANQGTAFFSVNTHPNEVEQMPTTYSFPFIQFTAPFPPPLTNELEFLFGPFNLTFGYLPCYSVNEACSDLPTPLMPPNSNGILGGETTIGNALMAAMRFVENETPTVESNITIWANLLEDAETATLLKNTLSNYGLFDNNADISELYAQIELLMTSLGTQGNKATVEALFATIDSLFALRVPQKAGRLLNYLTLSSTLETNFDAALANKFVIDATAKHRLGSALTQEEISNLEYLAGECYARFGEAVFQARSLLAATTGMIYPNVQCATPAERVVLSEPKQQTQQLLSVHPNPARKTTELVVQGQTIVSWQLMQITGRTMATGTTTQVDVTNIPGGLYIVAARLANGATVSAQLVVE